MKIVYVGQSRAPVEISHTRITAEFGVPVDVPAEIARGLLAQPDNWQRPPRKTKE